MPQSSQTCTRYGSLFENNLKKLVNQQSRELWGKVYSADVQYWGERYRTAKREGHPRELSDINFFIEEDSGM
jgi:hypothetical protein